MRFKYVAETITLKYDHARCRGCGACVEVCPHAVFRMNGKKAELSAKDYCIECGACMRNCNFDAIQVETGPGCASAVIASIVQIRKGPVSCRK